MRCRDDNCRCMCHVTPRTHVPVCAQHSAPLMPSENEPGHGFCGDCFRAGVHAHHKPEWWGWLHRDLFSGWDLPPANGWPELDVPQEVQ